MIRAVLAVVLAVALLAAAMPALGDARVRTTHEELGSMAERVARTAAELESGSTAVDDRPLAARTTLQLRLPTGFGAAPVETAAIGCPTAVLGDEGSPPAECDAALAYRLGSDGAMAAEEAAIRPFPGVEIRTPEGPVRLSESAVGLDLRFVRVDGAAVVEATRADAPPAET